MTETEDDAELDGLEKMFDNKDRVGVEEYQEAAEKAEKTSKIAESITHRRSDRSLGLNTRS